MIVEIRIATLVRMDVVFDYLLGKLFARLLLRSPLVRVALAVISGALLGGFVSGVIGARLWGEANALIAFWVGFALAAAWLSYITREKWRFHRDPAGSI